MMQWFFKQYLRTPEDGKNPLIDLVHADLKGLPAATVITAEIDPLRSEGKALADALRSAGAEVDYRNYEGSAHEFFGMGAVLDDAKAAQQQAAAGLKKGFHSPIARHQGCTHMRLKGVGNDSEDRWRKRAEVSRPAGAHRPAAGNFCTGPA